MHIYNKIYVVITLRVDINVDRHVYIFGSAKLFYTR